MASLNGKFAEVTTCLNSGNIVFSSTIEDKNTLTNRIVKMIKDRFCLDIPVGYILSKVWRNGVFLCKGN